MSGSFKPHTDILPPAQRMLWPRLKGATRLGYVLYGGTAVALRLGHRASIDFDFFTDQHLDKNELTSVFPDFQRLTILQDEPQTLTLWVKSSELQDQGVKVSFFGDINFGRLGEPDVTEDDILQVASLKDLLATKLKVLLQRVEAKDYIDIAAMIKAHVSLEEGLAGARALYGPNFQPSECLKALTYFQGGDLDTIDTSVKKTLIEAARRIRNLPNASVISERLSAPHHI